MAVEKNVAVEKNMAVNNILNIIIHIFSKDQVFNNNFSFYMILKKIFKLKIECYTMSDIFKNCFRLKNWSKLENVLGKRS